MNRWKRVKEFFRQLEKEELPALEVPGILTGDGFEQIIGEYPWTLGRESES